MRCGRGRSLSRRGHNAAVAGARLRHRLRFARYAGKYRRGSMLFGKRKNRQAHPHRRGRAADRVRQREMLGDAGYQIVATVDNLAEALRCSGEEVDLILSDVRLRGERRNGAGARGQGEGRPDPVRHRSRISRRRLKSRSVACGKPYTERQLCKAIDASIATCSVRRSSLPTGSSCSAAGRAAVNSFDRCCPSSSTTRTERSTSHSPNSC